MASTSGFHGGMQDRSATRRFWAGLVAIAAVAVILRALFPTADPPWNVSVGVVWHDEGAWVHNARNRAMFGQWSTDAWNPMYIAPVFTLLEYLSFATLGVGVWQARLVSEAAGIAAVVLLAIGVRRLAGDLAGHLAAALVATNYVFVMYNRAAIMESTMVAFIVASWCCYVLAEKRPPWGVAAAACALLAFFTKAAGAFFVGALALDAVICLVRPRAGSRDEDRRTGSWTLVGLAATGLAALAAFIVPNWTDYRFYNWQMSVTRKPSYDLKSLLDRITWFPILHDTFTRMWVVLTAAAIGAFTAVARWRELQPGRRLLILWIGLGAFELIVHDVGNERRFVFFIPALAALAAMLLADYRVRAEAAAAASRRWAAIAAPVLFLALYVVAGAIVRVFFLYQTRPGVRTAAAIAAAATVLLLVTWPRLPRWLATQRWTATAAMLLVAIQCAGDLAQYAQWAAGRTYKNYEASRLLGRVLPRGTLVHGKLANGLALENGIRPIFVGRGFGNYEDRKHRDDVRYILTYTVPSLGYESQARDPIIQDVLDAYPNRRIVLTFDVAETTGGHDRAALIDKTGGPPIAAPGGGAGRARD
jgi:4-amino-4-deoxy-L-arabinose transferase-like glycosyltransferase